jgi:sugar lactone lactonase YvrE
LGDAGNASAIFSANLDGSDVQTLVSEVFISEIAGIAIDPIHNKLYFTYINPLIDSLLNGGIARADLDGSNVEPIVGGQGKPIGITVDAAGGGIYWTDAMSISPAGGDGAIKAADLDGHNLRIIVGGLSLPFGVALDVAEQNVYWTDMGTGKIQRTLMSGILPYFQDVLTGLPSPTAIVVPTLPGDYNDDGTIDAADYVTWRKTNGTPQGFDIWRANFGHTATFGNGLAGALSSNDVVPEPASLLFVVLGVAGCCLRRDRHPSTWRRPPTLECGGVYDRS